MPYLKGLIVHAKGLAYLNFLENVSHDDADPALRGLSSLKICICMQERVSCFFCGPSRQDFGLDFPSILHDVSVKPLLVVGQKSTH